MAFHVCALKTSLSIGEIETNWIWMKSTTILTVVQRNLYFVKKVIILKSFKTGDESFLYKIGFYLNGIYLDPVNYQGN